jgi:hypothetical protein
LNPGKILSPDAEVVLAIIKRGLHGRTPTPALIDELEPLYRDAVPGCIVTINPLPKPPGGRRTAIVRYEFIMKGPRLDSRWLISNGWLIRHFNDVA